MNKFLVTALLNQLREMEEELLTSYRNNIELSYQGDLKAQELHDRTEKLDSDLVDVRASIVALQSFYHRNFVPKVKRPMAACK